MLSTYQTWERKEIARRWSCGRLTPNEVKTLDLQLQLKTQDLNLLVLVMMVV